MYNLVDDLKTYFYHGSRLGLARKILANPIWMNFINDKVKFLPSSASIIERTYCAVNDINARPTCHCGKAVSYKHGSDGYRSYCSTLCNRKFTMTPNAIKERKIIQKQVEDTFANNKCDVLKFDLAFAQTFILQNLLTKNGDINRNLIVKRNFFRRFGSNIYDKVMSDWEVNFKSINFNNYAYDIIYGKAICHTINCNKNCNFVNFKRGYLKFCSASCSNSNVLKKSTISYKLLNPSVKNLQKKALRLANNRKQILSDQIKILSKNYLILDPIPTNNEFSSNDTKYRLECLKCKNISESSFIYARCYICDPLQFNMENKIAEIFNTFSPITNKRGELEYKRLQLDILFKEQKLAIEYNGLHYHAANKETDKLWKNRHLHKTLECNKQGIKLLQIFENEWLDPKKQQIWQSIINNKLNNSTRYYARKTKLDNNITSIEARKFCDDNHLQGYVNAEFRFGLRDIITNELLMLMSFSKSRYSKKYDYELMRICSKLNCTVIGGASKLFTYAKTIFRHKSIVTFADLRYSNGEIYKLLGFEQQENNAINYFWYKGKILTRYQTQKHKLQNILDNFDPNKTEADNMFANGWRRVWDCGNLKFVYKA